MDQDRCEQCGQIVHIGEWPFCPHGLGVNNIEPDLVPGGFTVENGFDAPRTFYSKSEHRAALAAEGCELRVKWAGPHDRHITRWDIPSAKTLEDAKILLSRGKITGPVVSEETPYPIEKRGIAGPWPEGVEHG